jgi:uncharacterized protein involved in outer membrane biogenesis
VTAALVTGRRWGIYAAALVGLLVLAAVAAIAVVIARFEPADVARLLSAKVLEHTGRTLTIEGPVGYSLSLLPRLEANGVRLQNAAWGSRPDMVTAKQVEVQVSLLPLLAGHVVINGLVLVEPDVLLEVDREGRRNWQFGEPAASADKSEEDGRSNAIRIESATIEGGSLRYRDAAEERDLQIAFEGLTLAATSSRLRVQGKGTVNAVPVEIEGRLPPFSGKETESELTLSGPGLRVHAQGKMALPAKPRTLDLAFSAEASDWGAVGKLLQMQIDPMPALKASGSLQWAEHGLALENLEASLGKSSLRGHARLKEANERRTLDVLLEAPVLDVAELLGPGKTGPHKDDGRIFSAKPWRLGLLPGLSGNANVRIGRLALRDGKAVEKVELAATLDRGKITLGPAQLAIEGKPLNVRASADAADGKSLELDLAIDGRGIPLGALGALLNLTGTPEGSPTDIDLRLRGSGNSMRTLVANANGEVRVVIGRGRVRNRTIEFGADITELLKLLNPAYAADPYTELSCAVIRFPLRQGVARVTNGIGIETSKVNIIGAGSIDFRNETLDLGFRTKATSGLGLGIGTLADLGRLRGTLSHPDVEVDVGNAAKTAGHIGLAAITGGLSLIASGLLAERVPDHPCQVALNANTPSRSAQSEPGVVDSVIGGIKKFFGR